MKRLLFVLLVLCLSLTGCQKEKVNEEPENVSEPTDGGATMGGMTGVSWDCVEYTSIEEMNKAAGTNITSAAIAGKSDEWFGVISKDLAQYKFKVGNEEWCVRASKDVDNDISGIYSDSIDFKKDTTATYLTDNYDVLRFFHNGVQYVISLAIPEGAGDSLDKHFEEVANEFKTNITGVKSGYEVEIYEEGSNAVIKTTMYNDDGTSTILETTYVFENDKMVNIISKAIFETKEAAQKYLEELISYGKSKDDFKVEENVIISESSDNVSSYSEYNQKSFIDEMKKAYELQ